MTAPAAVLPPTVLDLFEHWADTTPSNGARCGAAPIPGAAGSAAGPPARNVGSRLARRMSDVPARATFRRNVGSRLVRRLSGGVPGRATFRCHLHRLTTSSSHDPRDPNLRRQ